MTRVRAITIALGLLTLPLAACGGDQEDSAQSAATPPKPAAITFPTTIDNCGEEVEVFQQPREILAVSTAAEKLIVGAGGAELVVARAGEDAGPPPAPVLSALGDTPLLPAGELSKEAIIGSGADTVISYGLDTQLSAANISSITIAGGCGVFVGESQGPVTFATIYSDLALFGRLFGTERAASDTVADLKQRVSAVEANAGSDSATTAASGYFFGETLSTNGSRSIQHTWLETLGVTNVFGDIDKEFIEGNTEELIERDPEIFVLGFGYDGEETFAQAKEKFLEIPGVSETRAASSGTIIGVPASESEPDPYAVAGLERIARELANSSPR